MSGPVDLVFEGGGVKGVGLAGAYAALEEEGWEPPCVAGASAGAITATLVAAGYSGAELREEVLALQFREFKDEGCETESRASADRCGSCATTASTRAAGSWNG